MDETQFDILSKKLDTIAALLASNIIKDKPVGKQIEILTIAGLKASEIASILGKTENQVYVTQTQLRKKKKVSGKTDQEQLQKEEEHV